MKKLVCKHCGGDVPLNSARCTEDGDVICPSCASKYYIKCNQCGNYINRSFKRGTCKICDSLVYKKFINNYSVKPIPRFKSKKYQEDKGIRFMGYEMEFNNLSPEAAYSLFNDLYREEWMYNKHDSSISSGVEIVTNPMDRASIKKLFNRMREGLEVIKEVRGYKDCAGVHIHVNRKSIDPIDVYKLGYLFNYKMPSLHKRMLYYISGRNDTSTRTEDNYSYCTLGSMQNKKKLNKPAERYQAINLNNTNTIEFRLFKTVADADILESYAEFVDRSLEYCHTHGFKDMNIPSFVIWLYKNTTNDIIKRRITTFQRSNGKFIPMANKYTTDINLMKGINITKYEDLINAMKQCVDVNELNEIMDWYKTHNGRCSLEFLRGRVKQTDFAKKNQFISKLENTLKKVLISKIMKGIEQCA